MTLFSSSPFSLRRLDRWLAPWLPWLIISLALGLRLWRLDSQSLWADEGNSAALALRSWGDISLAAAADIHPPLYYWLLNLWVELFDLSENGLRSLSVFASAATVGLTYDLGRRLFGRVAGLLAAFLLAIAPFHVYYAQEARMYALLTLWATLLAASFVIFLQQEMIEVTPGRREPPLIGATPGFIFAVTAILGLYTHYLFPLMLLVVNLVYGAWLISTWARPFRRLRTVRWLFLHLVIVFGYWAWAGIALERLRAWPAPPVSEQGIGAIFSALRLLVFGPTADAIAALWLWPALAILLLGLLPLAIDAAARPAAAPAPTSPAAAPPRKAGPASTRRRASASPRPAAPATPPPPAPGAWTAWALPVLWLLAPLGLLLAFGLFKEAYLKFLLLASPALALLLARGLLLPLALLRRAPAAAEPVSGRNAWLALSWLTLGLVGVSVGAALALNVYYTDPAFARDDYRGMVRTINALATPQDAILLDAPGQRDVFTYYYRGDLPVLALPAQRPPLPAETIADLAADLAGKRRVYALFWATDESDPQRIVETWLDQNAYKVQDAWQGNVRFVIYSLPQATAPMQPLAVAFAPLADLAGLALSVPALPSGEVLEITLRWQVKAASSQRFKVFLQLLDGSNQVWAQRDAEPAGESRPTSTWQPGEVIEDRHGLLIAPGTPPGRYRLIAGLYDAATGVRLRTSDADFVDLGLIEVTRPDAPWPRAAFTMQTVVDRQLHDVILLGYNHYPRGFSHAPETPLRRGDILHLDLFWQAVAAPKQGQQMTVSLDGPASSQVVSEAGPLASAGYPSSLWQPGEIVRGQLDLPLPADLPAGVYRVVMHVPGTIPIAGADIGMVNIE